MGLYLYLLQYNESAEIDSTLVYKHNKSLGSFQNIIASVFEIVLHTKALDYKIFKPVENLLSTGIIEFEALNRRRHYLVVRKPVEDYVYSLSVIKLTSPSRVVDMHKYAMVGLKLSKLGFNPLPSSNIDKY
jgi:predicted component of type VI protein secretion system